MHTVRVTSPQHDGCRLSERTAPVAGARGLSPASNKLCLGVQVWVPQGALLCQLLSISLFGLLHVAGLSVCHPLLHSGAGHEGGPRWSCRGGCCCACFRPRGRWLGCRRHMASAWLAAVKQFFRVVVSGRSPLSPPSPHPPYQGSDWCPWWTVAYTALNCPGSG